MVPFPSRAAITPVRPIAGYVGGKRGLAKRLVALIEEIPHETYAEPFVGMGGVFLRRLTRPPAEVINDWSLDVGATTWPSSRCCGSSSPPGRSSSA
jgi:DNA adenine methylase